MLPILLAVGIGVAVGLARGGRLSAVARARLRHPEFLLIALACSIFIDMTDTGPTLVIAVVGLIAGVFFGLFNAHLTGMIVLTLGILSNLVPLAVNGAMPVRGDALVEAGMVTAEELPRVSLTGARELADDTTRLEFLGDTFPVHWTGQVLSIGDLIMMVGLADVVAHLLLKRRRRRVPSSAHPSLAALGWQESAHDFQPIDLRSTVIDLRDDRASIGAASNPSDTDGLEPLQRLGAGWGRQPTSAASNTASPVHD